MVVLSHTFLELKAQELSLTPEQQEVFVLKFGEQKTNQEIAQWLNISTNACVQCLGEIYKKADIEGRSRGKAKKLYSELLREAEERQRSRPPLPFQAASVNMTFTPVSLQALPGEGQMGVSSHGSAASEVQYLRTWMSRIEKHEERLRTEKGWEEVDSALQFFAEHLPASASALAAGSRFSKLEVVQQILGRISSLFSKLSPCTSTEVFEISFLGKKNPLNRSISAFLGRLCSQFCLGSELQDRTRQDILDELYRRGEVFFAKASHHPPNKTLMTYSAWVRKNSFDLFLEKLDEIKFVEPVGGSCLGEQRLQLDQRADIARNLLAIDTAILNLYLASRDPDEAHFDFFNILFSRWIRAMPWGEKSLHPEIKPEMEQDDDMAFGMDVDARSFEWMALRMLRREYHTLDGKSRLELTEYFERKLAPFRERYHAHFWDGYRESVVARAVPYAVVSIPEALCRYDKAVGEVITQDIWRYCELSAYNYLTAQNLQELSELLQKAQRQPVLDFWFNEIDHMISHSLEDAKGMQGISLGIYSRV